MLRRLKNDQAGIALVMAVGMLAVFSIVSGTLVLYTTSNARSGSFSKENELSFSLAEAGLNNAMAVLSKPTNNALDPDVLPSTEQTASSSSYESGTAKWYGTLDRAAAVWSITSIGVYNNPSGPSAGQVRRKLTAKVPVIPTYTQPLNNPVWNYLYAGHTGSTCDQTLNNNISGSSRMYIAGNLCLSPNVNLAQSQVIVRGDLDVSNNAAVGANTNMSTRVETYVGGNCRYSVGSWAACSGDQDARHIYSKLSDGTTVGVNHTAPVVAPPAADFAGWYENAIPGPSQTCTSSSGTPPTFDTNYPNRDNSVTSIFNMTPAAAYDCRVGTASNPSGEIKWTPPTATAPGQLYMQGTIFIDGSATVTTGTASSTFAVQYTGESTLYLSGTFYLNGKLCASLTSAKYDCSFPSWNPNSTMMTIVANGSGGRG